MNEKTAVTKQEEKEGKKEGEKKRGKKRKKKKGFLEQTAEKQTNIILDLDSPPLCFLIHALYLYVMFSILPISLFVFLLLLVDVLPASHCMVPHGSASIAILCGRARVQR